MIFTPIIDKNNNNFGVFPFYFTRNYCPSKLFSIINKRAFSSLQLRFRDASMNIRLIETIYAFRYDSFKLKNTIIITIQGHR